MCFTAPMAVNDHSRRLLLRTTSLQPPPAHLPYHGLEPGEERRRVRKVQCRATADRKKQMDLEHVEQPPPHCSVDVRQIGQRGERQWRHIYRPTVD